MKTAYRDYLAKMVSQAWVDAHPEIVAAWWRAGIIGGAFRAGVRYGRAQERAAPTPPSRIKPEKPA